MLQPALMRACRALASLKLTLAAGVWSDRQGRIYVADMFNGRVVIFQFLGGD
ncbi:MAG: hypothetical protein ACYCTW_01270 [Sulfuricella sp.]